jgi:hypothetical protein
MALQLVLVDGLVEQVLYMGNPEKLAGIAAAAGQGGPPAGAGREPASGEGPGGSCH